MTRFAGISLRQWRQFAEVDLDLNQQTTIITGANGAGKTTILTALSMHFGWSLSFVSTPSRRNTRLKNLWSDVYSDKIYEPSDDADPPNDRVQVGAIRYDNGHVCPLLTQVFVGANYQLEYSSIQPVTGMYIPSHRPAAVFNPITNIPTNPVEAQSHYQQYQQFMIQLFGGGNARNPGTVQKQSLISFAVFGEGNSSVRPNREFLDLFEDFQQKLKILMPEEVGFERLEVRSGDLVIVSRSGDFAVDAMSGGINAVFSIAWQISMFGANLTSNTVIIDEPENHLHPSMQRTLLPALARAYPSTRFIVSTHSPFIITSFPEAAVYGLSHNARKKVVSARLDISDLSGTPNTILREILGVESTLPIWVEDRVRSVLRDASNLGPEERGQRVMELLNELNISDSISDLRPE